MTQEIETARKAFLADLLTGQPGDEPYDLGMRIGDIELYRLRRALCAAIKAYELENR